MLSSPDPAHGANHDTLTYGLAAWGIHPQRRRPSHGAAAKSGPGMVPSSEDENEPTAFLLRLPAGTKYPGDQLLGSDRRIRRRSIAGTRRVTPDRAESLREVD